MHTLRLLDNRLLYKDQYAYFPFICRIFQNKVTILGHGALTTYLTHYI